MQYILVALTNCSQKSHREVINIIFSMKTRPKITEKYPELFRVHLRNIFKFLLFSHPVNKENTFKYQFYISFSFIQFTIQFSHQSKYKSIKFI